jgi:hypothetical protein
MLSEEAIKEACEDFIKAALNLLNRSFARGEPLLYRTIEDAKFQEGHLTKFFYRNELAFDSFVEKHKERIKRLTEFSRCIELSKTLDVENFDEELLTLLVRIIKKRKDFGFDQRVFESIYSMFKDYLFSSEFIFRITAPLNSGCDVKDMDLGDGLKIRSITDEELQELWGRSRFGAISRSDIPFFKHTLELEYTISKNSSLGTHQEKTEILNDLITALRLFKRGGVSFNTYRVSPKGWTSRSNLTFSEFSISSPKTSYGGGNYVLEEEPEIEQFQKFWRTFKESNFQSVPFLKMAIGRFNFAYEKRSHEDKLIDYMISFESLFMKETQELRHRLSVRVSRFLKGKYNERKDLFSDFKKIYDIRSAIVHGESINPKDLKKLKVESLSELVSNVEEPLRESIKKFIDLIDQDVNYNHKEFLDKLDLNNI